MKKKESKEKKEEGVGVFIAGLVIIFFGIISIIVTDGNSLLEFTEGPRSIPVLFLFFLGLLILLSSTKRKKNDS